jgi:bifunctional DNA-binding transcriptional regulator/antitoxin component of YhaV-PrlF toxin-antitoxin module
VIFIDRTGEKVKSAVFVEAFNVVLSKGRAKIPKAVRDELGLKNDSLPHEFGPLSSEIAKTPYRGKTLATHAAAHRDKQRKLLISNFLKDVDLSKDYERRLQAEEDEDEKQAIVSEMEEEKRHSDSNSVSEGFWLDFFRELEGVFLFFFFFVRIFVFLFCFCFHFSIKEFVRRFCHNTRTFSDLFIRRS